MPNIETIQPYVTLIKDVLTGIAALVAAYVGFTGLQTWKKQLTANAERELARRVLVAVFKVRDAIEGCRVLAWASDGETSDETKKIHEAKFDKLDAAKSDLDVELLEAEAVWGNEPDYRSWVVRLSLIVSDIKGAYEIYYSDSPHLSAGKENASIIIFAQGTFPKDEFGTRIDRVVKLVEEFLRPKLTLKREKRQAW